MTVMMWQPELVGLEDVQQLARARPDQLELRRRLRSRRGDSATIGIGSRPVSATRPANSEMKALGTPASFTRDVVDLRGRS